MKEFMAPGGMYEKQMKKMLYHKAHVKLLGKMHMLRHRQKEAALLDAVEFQRDHAEKYTPAAPNGQIQSEYYGQDVSISMEGAATKFKPLPTNNEGVDSTQRRLEFYSHISNDKRQNGNTVYENIRYTLNDLCKRGMIKRDTLKIVMDIVDGCGEQYRCGKVLYFLAKLSFEFDMIYDRAVQAPGHGKCIVDALNGIDKRVLDAAIRCKSAIAKTEKNISAGALTMGLHQIDTDGKRVSAAKWAFNELTSDERKCGIYAAGSNNKKATSQVIEKRTYHYREEDAANLESIVKKAVGLDSGMYNHLGDHYNFVADGPLLGLNEIACRRIPCSCVGGCMVQRQMKTKDERP